MQCVTPMIRKYQELSLLPPDMRAEYENGDIKLKQRIVPRSEVMQKLNDFPNLIRDLEIKNKQEEASGSVWRYQQIPCQHCWACQLNYSAQWATRIMYECTKSKHNFFITFTYDDLSLPIPTEATYEGQTFQNDGTWTGTLLPADIDRFLNSLRKEYERKGHTGIKYFYCGEYGNPENTYRPHYHMILMNCPLDIEQFYDFDEDKRGKLHWKSHELDKYWNEQGFIDIGEVEWASAAYVARYCMKKISNDTDKSVYYSQGKEPEFIRMSRRPGIGLDYFNEHHLEIYKYDEVHVKNFHNQTITVKPGRYWDNKFKELYPKEFERLKESRKKAAERAAKIKREMTDMTDMQMLQLANKEILRKGKHLPRDM